MPIFCSAQFRHIKGNIMLTFLNQFEGTDALILGLATICTMLISFSLHEYAHALVAYWNGDQTAKALGRLTINPIVHMDPIGTICCFLFGFGWAKPVPINPLQFRHYKKGVVTTSLAGITMNLILAFLSSGAWAAMVYFVDFTTITSSALYYFLEFLYAFFLMMSTINVTLFVFNLLPIYPLDGFRVVEAVCKYDNKYVSFMRRYGSYVLLVFILVGSPLISMLMDIVQTPIMLFWGLFF